jgi:hypothetical protein
LNYELENQTNFFIIFGPDGLDSFFYFYKQAILLKIHQNRGQNNFSSACESPIQIDFDGVRRNSHAWDP